MVPSSNSFTFTANVEDMFGAIQQVCGAATTEQLEEPIVMLRTAFNAAAPANHLPTELVIKILTSGAWNNWRELVALTHICQHWRNIALGVPQLWADAAQSAFKSDGPRWNYQCLPTFIARSGSCPLNVDLDSLAGLTIDIEDMGDSAVLEPHLQRVIHLSALCLNITELVEFVGDHALDMCNLQGLHFPYIKRTFLGIPIVIDANKLRFWRDTDFPHLHTLTISAYCFKKHIAVPSLKDLVLHDEPLTYNEFLAALKRCAPGLESLTLRGWSHPEWPSRAQTSSTCPIQLPNLRRFRVSLNSHSSSTAPLAFLFASLSFPPDVSIHLDWKCNPGNAHHLLPKHLAGLHAPPFFDSLCLHLYAAPFTTSMHCYVGDAQRLCVRERPLHPRFPKSRSFGDFLDEHRHPSITQLAIDIEMDADSRKELTLSGHREAFREFICGLPNLHRLDLLGNSVRGAKLDFAKAFLGLSKSVADGCSPTQPTVAATKTLGYVCGEYGDDGLRVSVDSELARLERLLKAHIATGGLRLGRLEICAADPLRETHVTSLPVYPYVRDVPPSTDMAASLWLKYALRFTMLVDEVVFVGHVERRGPGYRVLPRAAVAEHSTLSRGEKVRGAKAHRKSTRKGC
uniref:Flavohemoglobin n=1 Tax=Ganoderma boninense TaxID=34458 RepID=A0A5K1JWC6_9APHY|nr:Flavohemoglobin [Ganoderma boninense]